MTRVIKTVKDFGSVTVGTSSQTLETQAIKALGDVLSWGVYSDLTTVGGTGAEKGDGGTPSGSWQGANVDWLFRRISLKDNGNKDLLQCQGTDIRLMAYLLSIVDPNEFLFDRGLAETHTTTTGDETNLESMTIFAQSVLLKDLPASLEIEIGVLGDFFSTVGTATAVINALTVWVRYAPNQESGVTIRINAFNITAFSADQDIAHFLPENLNILKLAYMPSNPNNATAPTDMVNTRVTRVSFRRGANEEIEESRRVILDDWQDQVNTGNRPTGLTVIPTDAFIKTSSTLLKFFVNAQVTPRIYYVYQS
jgi:hypothetical protein